MVGSGRVSSEPSAWDALAREEASLSASCLQAEQHQNTVCSLRGLNNGPRSSSAPTKAGNRTPDRFLARASCPSHAPDSLKPWQPPSGDT